MTREEEAALKKRLEELAGRSRGSGRYVYTDFLGLAERDVLERSRAALDGAGIRCFGGTENCERVMARFGQPDYDEPFPVSCVKIEPRSRKFAEELTHRDLLGALMSRGIRREKLGDIFLQNNIGYLFCAKETAPFLARELTSVRHTPVVCEILSQIPEGLGTRCEERTVPVASERPDALVAAVFSLSRADAAALFEAGNVFRDGRVCTGMGTPLREGETVSVRGLGRFRYRGIHGQSRMGRLYVTVEIFV